MKFVETIKNIFKIEELRKRLVYTFLLILVYRLGCFVVLPGIDASMLASLQSTDPAPRSLRALFQEAPDGG